MPLSFIAMLKVPINTCSGADGGGRELGLWNWINWNVIDSDVNVAAAVAGSTALDDDEQTVDDDHRAAVDHDATAVDEDLRALDSQLTASDDNRTTPAPAAPVNSSSEPSTSVSQQQISSLPDGWVLNSDEYFTRVADKMVFLQKPV